MSNTGHAEKQRLLDAFLVDNQELESLSARLARFNLFSVLKIEKAEIRHSNVLAWLLDPRETHGLGDTFLRRFLSRLLMEKEVDVKLTPAQVELMNFNDVEVLREWMDIDVSVRSRSGNWSLLIENKIHSKEKKGALSRYREAVEKEGQLARGKKSVKKETPTHEIIPVFLTLEGDEPSAEGLEAGFVTLSHVEILDLVERIIEQHAARIPGDARTFLSHYLDTLRRLTMQDQELTDLCKTIYRKHREAIDLIVESGSSWAIRDAVQEQTPALVDCEFVVAVGSGVWFLPNEMAGYLPPAVKLTAWPHLPRKVPIAWWFNCLKKDGKLGLILEVGPIADWRMRKRLLEAIKKSGPNIFTITDKSLEEGAKYTRFLSKYRKLRSNADGELDDDPDYIKGVAESLWKELSRHMDKVTDVLKKFDWDSVD